MTKYSHLLMSFACVLMLAACGADVSTNQGDGIAAVCPTAQPCLTQVSTEAPSPPEALPPPEEINIALGSPRLVDQMTEFDLDEFWHENTTVDNNGLTVRGEGWAILAEPLIAGEAVLVEFEYGSVGSSAGEIGYDVSLDLRTPNDYGSAEYYGRGLNINEQEGAGYYVIARGEFLEGVPVTGSLRYSSGTKLYALFTVDFNAVFLQYVWDPEGGYADVWSYAAGEEFNGLAWVFNVYVGQGQGYVTITRIDRYTFDEIQITKNTSDWSGVWYFSGIGGGPHRVSLTQEGDAVRGNIEIDMLENFFIEGTAFRYHDPRGGSYDVLRGLYSLDTWGAYLGQVLTIGLDWRMGDDSSYIFGRGHRGGSVQFLDRSAAAGWPDIEDWYYSE